MGHEKVNTDAIFMQNARPTVIHVIPKPLFCLVGNGRGGELAESTRDMRDEVGIQRKANTKRGGGGARNGVRRALLGAFHCKYSNQVRSTERPTLLVVWVGVFFCVKMRCN